MFYFLHDYYHYGNSTNLTNQSKWQTITQSHKDTHFYKSCIKLICTFGYNSKPHGPIINAKGTGTESKTFIYKHLAPITTSYII